MPPLNDLTAGFSFGPGESFAWGTTMKDLKKKSRRKVLRAPREGLASFSSGKPWAPLSDLFIPLSVDVFSSGEAGPVYLVQYSLAAAGTRREEAILKELSSFMGKPKEVLREDPFAPGWKGGRPEDTVVLNARWNRPGLEVSVSLFGAARKIEEGMSSGILYVKCTDAAKLSPGTAQSLKDPFWEKPDAGREVWLIPVEGLYMREDYDYPRKAKPEDMVESNCCVIVPPAWVLKALKGKESSHALAWRDKSRGFWGLSDARHMGFFGPGQMDDVSYDKEEPGRFSGGLNISVSLMSIAAAYSENGLDALADFLKKEIGLSVKTEKFRMDY